MFFASPSSLLVHPLGWIHFSWTNCFLTQSFCVFCQWHWSWLLNVVVSIWGLYGLCSSSVSSHTPLSLPSWCPLFAWCSSLSSWSSWRNCPPLSSSWHHPGLLMYLASFWLPPEWGWPPSCSRAWHSNSWVHSMCSYQRYHQAYGHYRHAMEQTYTMIANFRHICLCQYPYSAWEGPS